LPFYESGIDKAHRRVIFASSLGTVFEWYDFYLYGSLAAIISKQFFSGVNETTGFIFALLAFAAGFAVRPFGALFFGRLGDLVGRKHTFLITIVIMGLSTALVGVLPSYASAGVIAPVALIVLRLLQGLALGGDQGRRHSRSPMSPVIRSKKADQAPRRASAPSNRSSEKASPARRLRELLSQPGLEVMPGCYSLIVDGRSHDLEVVAAAGVGGRRWALILDGETYAAEVGGRSQPAGVPGGAAAGIGEVRAPMPGLLVAVRVAEGAEVALGQPLIIMEAMKMQMEIRAPRAGTVRQVHAAPGQEIAGGQLLTTIE